MPGLYHPWGKTLSSLTSRIGKGSAWISATRGLVNLLGLLSTIVLARLLAPSDFGLVALGTTMMLLVTAITDMSLAQALVHHRDPTDEHMHTAWTLGVLRGLILGGLFAATGPLMADFFRDDRLPSVMMVLGCSIALSGAANPRRVLLQRQLIFWQDFLLNVSQKLIGVVVSIAVAVIYHSYWALLVGTLAGQIAQVGISYTAMPYRPRLSVRHFKDLWSFSLWLSLTQIINTINWNFDQILIGKFLGPTALGFYTVGNNLATMPTRESTQPLTRTLFPAFAHLRHDPERLRRAYQRVQALVTAVALPLGVGMAVVAEPLVLLAMGQKWLPAVLVIQAIASVVALQTIGSLSQPLAMSKGETRTIFTRSLRLFLYRIPFIVLGMYYDGLRGILIARVLVGTTGIFASLHIVKQLTGLGYREQLWANRRALLAVSAMAGGVGTLIHFWPSPSVEHFSLILHLAVYASVGAFIYVGLSMLIWTIEGRPDGPETEIARLLGKLASKFTRKEVPA